MHVPKIWQVEKVGWYRENSVRFVRLSGWRPVTTIVVMLGIIPFLSLQWAAASKVCPRS